eukprot:14959834-Alexandrium_andersonii.AAC.1
MSGVVCCSSPRAARLGTWANYFACTRAIGRACCESVSSGNNFGPIEGRPCLLCSASHHRSCAGPGGLDGPACDGPGRAHEGPGRLNHVEMRDGLRCPLRERNLKRGICSLQLLRKSKRASLIAACPVYAGDRMHQR